MILKKQVYQPDKKANPFIGLLLFFIAIVLFIITAPVGFVYGLFHSLFTRGFRGIGEYLLKIAISIDQLGNVLMQYLLNVLWVKRYGYKFGNRDETISSALGRNRKLDTLTSFGKFVDKFLDLIDPDHSLNSIDYYVEPSEQIIDKLAWIHIVDGKILVTKSKGKEKYYIPGGNRENGESDAETLFREVKEELTVELQLSSLDFVGMFDAQADDQNLGILVRMSYYKATYTGNLKANSEIEEIKWFNFQNRDRVSYVDTIIFEFLKDRGDLV